LQRRIGIAHGHLQDLRTSIRANISSGEDNLTNNVSRDAHRSTLRTSQAAGDVSR